MTDKYSKSLIPKLHCSKSKTNSSNYSKDNHHSLRSLTQKSLNHLYLVATSKHNSQIRNSNCPLTKIYKNTKHLLPNIHKKHKWPFKLSTPLQSAITHHFLPNSGTQQSTNYWTNFETESHMPSNSCQHSQSTL